MSDEAPEPADDGYVRWAALPMWGKAARVFAAAWIVWHAAAMLVMGGSQVLQKAGRPVFGFYAHTLKLTNTWGMFSKRPSATNVRIEAVDVWGRKTVLSTTHAVGKSAFARFRDARLRKIQAKLAGEADRGRFGTPYLDGFCRTHGQHVMDVEEVRAVREVHALYADDGRRTRTPREEVVLRRSCSPRGLRPRTLRVPDADPTPADEAEL